MNRDQKVISEIEQNSQNPLEQSFNQENMDKLLNNIIDSPLFSNMVQEVGEKIGRKVRWLLFLPDLDQEDPASSGPRPEPCR